MAYIPDKLSERRRAENVSSTAYEIFVKYCEHADQDSGLTLANPKTVANAWNMRSDNVKKYDSELQSKGWIEIIIEGGRTYRKVKAGWIPRHERKRKQEINSLIETEFLKFRNEFSSLLKFRDSSYILGEIPKFKEKLLNFRNAYKEYIDQPINQQIDQLFDQIATASLIGTASAARKNSENFSDNRDEKPNRVRGGRLSQTDSEPICRLPEEFEISSAMREWAAKFAPNVDLEAWTIEFKNYWIYQAKRNNERSLRAWLATWENRMITIQSGINENLRRTEVWKQTNQTSGKSKAEIERQERDSWNNVGKSHLDENPYLNAPFAIDVEQILVE